MLTKTEPCALFQFYVSELHFPHLKYFDLCNWTIPQKELQNLLERHALTLRELRILDGLFNGDTGDMSRWAGEKLELTGVQLEGNSTLDVWYMSEAAETYNMLENWDETVWLAGRNNWICREEPYQYVDGLKRSNQEIISEDEGSEEVSGNEGSEEVSGNGESEEISEDEGSEYD